MRRIPHPLIMFLAAAGCSDKKLFTDLGNGTNVPSESVGAYAAAHGLTRQQAKQEMLIKSQEKKAAEALQQTSRDASLIDLSDAP